jgi:hypothetical protein
MHHDVKVKRINLCLCSRWRQIVIFMGPPVYPQEGAVDNHWVEDLMGLRTNLGTIMKEKVLAPAVIES